MADELFDSNDYLMDFIEAYPNALSDDVCDRLMSALDNHSATEPGRTGAGVDLSKKHSLDLMLDAHPELNSLRAELMSVTFEHTSRYFEQYSLGLIGAVSVDVTDEAGKSVCLTPENFATLGKPRVRDVTGFLYRSGTVNVQKYRRGEGGYPHWHSEQFPQLGSHEALHRVVLYMYYLNDVAVGGETEFYYQQRKIQPRKGTMVIAPAGFTHSHRGNMPVSDDKYIATSWILFNRAEKIYPNSNGV